MWPVAGATLVAGGLLPSAALWLAERGADPGASAAAVWRAAGLYSAVDAAFVVSALLFLWIAVRYGQSRPGAAPYPGAWVEADGRQVPPRGFPPYLGVAFVTSIIAPSLALGVCLVSSAVDRGTAALAAATLGPYLLVFGPQVALETRLLSRSVVTPLLPVLFAYYRVWQLVRSLGLAAAAAAAATAAGWFVWGLLALLAFWIFDTGCTILWLPGMFDWSLQDPAKLARLVELRKQQAAAAAAAAAAERGKRREGAPPAAPAPAGSPAAAAKARRRQRLEDHSRMSSGDYDSYRFGT